MGQVTRRDARTRRAAVLELAAQGLGPRAIARALDMPERTVKGHLADPSVSATLRQLADDRLRRVARQALAAAEDAVGVLAAIAQDMDVSVFARLGAAKAILEVSVRLLESAELVERVAALEAHHAEQSRPREVAGWRA